MLANISGIWLNFSISIFRVVCRLSYSYFIFQLLAAYSSWDESFEVKLDELDRLSIGWLADDHVVFEDEWSGLVLAYVQVYVKSRRSTKPSDCMSFDMESKSIAIVWTTLVEK